jgi:hypothetical protein
MGLEGPGITIRQSRNGTRWIRQAPAPTGTSPRVYPGCSTRRHESPRPKREHASALTGPARPASPYACLKSTPPQDSRTGSAYVGRPDMRDRRIDGAPRPHAGNADLAHRVWGYRSRSVMIFAVADQPGLWGSSWLSVTASTGHRSTCPDEWGSCCARDCS